MIPYNGSKRELELEDPEVLYEDKSASEESEKAQFEMQFNYINMEEIEGG